MHKSLRKTKSDGVAKATKNRPNTSPNLLELHEDLMMEPQNFEHSLRRYKSDSGARTPKSGLKVAPKALELGEELQELDSPSFEKSATLEECDRNKRLLHALDEDYRNFKNYVTQELKVRLEKMEAEHGSQTEPKYQRLEKIEPKLQRLDTIETKLQRLDRLEPKLQLLDTIAPKLHHLDTIESKLQRFDTIEPKLQCLDTIEVKLQHLDTISQIEFKLLETISLIEPKLQHLDKIEPKIQRIDTIESKLQRLDTIEPQLHSLDRTIQQTRVKLEDFEAQSTLARRIHQLNLFEYEQQMHKKVQRLETETKGTLDQFESKVALATRITGQVEQKMHQMGVEAPKASEVQQSDEHHNKYHTSYQKENTASRPTIGDVVFVLDTSNTRRICPHLIGKATKITKDEKDHWPFKVDGCNSVRFLSEADVASEIKSNITPLTSAKLGVVVWRGPDWNWGDQDGGVGQCGMTIARDNTTEGWVGVHWDTGSEMNCRVGAEGAYDLMSFAEVPQ